jgi:hypothetical protein
MEFKHPKYYAALRAERRKLQASSAKLKPEPSSGSSDNQDKLQAPSGKPQAPSRK